jgi:hypothetical protein
MTNLVSALSNEGDWTFGRGRAGYRKNSEAVRQNVVARLRCFTNDWFLDVRDGIDWYALLGKRGTEPQILREVERRVLTTAGVRSIDRLEVMGRDNRVLTVMLRFTTIFEDTVEENVKVTI